MANFLAQSFEVLSLEIVIDRFNFFLIAARKMFKFVPAKRAGYQNLEIAGYRYRKNKTTKTKSFYICVEKIVRQQPPLILI